MNAGMFKELKSSFDAALEKLPEVLKAEGFGIITQIDLKETFKAKLGKDFGRYRILGACNPSFAHEAVTTDPSVGLLLPCNVILYEKSDGRAVLGAIDPVATIGRAGIPALEAVAQDVRARLARAMEQVP